ncbi:hypothetical protein N7520_009863 [Penicillium odoratum]|uniref:uncharacterized protein n=1 Tax=Penicillium odoratum TaxID=1167516 RepID=UPI0025484379|nr:uncharacterized protein N7520_009863 [Penicillium odoratum]KAJ5752946.1 hypothetical protein N7520_009863 [Penicillium odoratum]
MADPYNPYTSYSTPTPGGVGYYPPEEHVQQQAYPYQLPYDNYSNTQLQQRPNYDYNAQPSQYHLAPDAYQNAAQERSYTPTGQPDHLGPVPTPAQGGKSPGNMGYYDGHPDQQPRYTPSPGPTPALHVSEATGPQFDEEGRPLENEGETDRGLGSSLAGGAAGYYLGHKKDHGFLGAIGGAIVANLVEHKVKDHRKESSGGHEHEHGHEHGHHGHHHHHHHSRSRSHSRHRGEEDY